MSSTTPFPAGGGGAGEAPSRGGPGAAWWALGGALWLLLLPGWEALSGPADLAPTMPELDAVHPSRALEALETAYAPGTGFPDKYPPLGSVLMGLAVALTGGDLPSDVHWRAAADQRRLLWEQRDDVAAALVAERWVSRLAMALAVAMTMALAAALARRVGVRATVAERLVPVIVLAAFGATYPVAYYGATANVDALALAASVGAVLATVKRRWTAAAWAAALATSIKDPAFVLGPVVVLAAALDGREGRGRRALRTTLVGLAVYAVASGAVTTPSVWWEHLRYLVSGGVELVDRIDPGDVTQWPGLVAYCGRLVLGSAGWLVLVGAVAGWVLVARVDGRSAVLLLGVVLATLALFVIPAGFAYVRFLLLPLALVGACAAVLAGALLEPVLARSERTDPGRRFLYVVGVVGAIAGLGWLLERAPSRWGLDAPRGPMTELGRILGEEPDPRRAAAEAVAATVPEGSRVVLFTSARSHGPPFDPTRWRVDVRGLNEAASAIQGWLDAPPGARPECLLFMAFPTEPPSGRDPLPDDLPEVGDRVGVHFEIQSVFGRPRGTVAERTLAVRPTLTLLRRVDDEG